MAKHPNAVQAEMIRICSILATVFSCAVISHGALARDIGYALECRSDSGPVARIVSFLETDTGKTVNATSTGSIRMWDTHEWSDAEILVNSYMQRAGDDEPSLVSSIRINRDTLDAILETSSSSRAPSSMSCQRWSPRTRNK